MILITGSEGYIGTNFLSRFRYLLEFQEHDIATCDIKQGLDFADIKNQDFDLVVHLAAIASVTESMKDPDRCLENNAFKLIPFLKNNRIGRFVFASTGCAIYGNKHDAREEDVVWSTILSPYGQSKCIAEKIIQQMHPNHIILRLGNVWGGIQTRDDLLQSRLEKDNPIVVFGGNQTRDFIHMDSVCSAIIQASQNSETGIFNIGTGKATNVRDLAENVAVRRGVSRVIKEPRKGEVTHISLNIDKAVKTGLIKREKEDLQ